MDTGLGLSSQGAKVPYFFVPRKSACPLTHPPKFVRGCIFSPKSGKKQNTVLFYFSWNYFALQAVNFIGGALIKIKVKSCHCSTSFYPYLCCIFFLNDNYFFPVFSWKLFKPHSLTRFKRLYLFPIQVFYSPTRLWVKMPQK